MECIACDWRYLGEPPFSLLARVGGWARRLNTPDGWLGNNPSRSPSKIQVPAYDLLKSRWLGRHYRNLLVCRRLPSDSTPVAPGACAL